MTTERLLGEGRHRIDYRHIIWSLVRKPGAFERYRYREALFPGEIFRVAFDALQDNLASTRKEDIEYLRILHLAASTMECEVEAALRVVMARGKLPTSGHLKQLLSSDQPEIPAMEAVVPDLEIYDSLLGQVAEVRS